ncbi:glutathione S-transferase family protein [Hydrogenophaga sp.]|uniref:glutathione S-transferase family protein n=1 Tax=Hydrogenophaga sp. TaxID=1904254 RepID=UPI00271D6204|nr:glutathione S-transferase N-terminal domain-containing protein [Hydrogenophaga sp.]MDO9434214.1 glutathione S-transferase N-terminal domain-containing protein [Hydrogenophaga sp.]
MMHLWGRLSSLNVRKVVLCTQVLGIELPRTDAGLAYGVVNTPDYRAQNPNGLVPLLRDGDYSLWESNAIVRYLCAKVGRLYPEDLQQRFDAERWMDWQQTTINPAGSAAFKQWIRTAPEQRNAEVIAQSVAATEPLFAMLDEHLSRQPFMAGDELTMADIPIACEVHRWWALPQPRPAWPHLERWYAVWLALPASRGVLDQPLS